MSEAQNLSGPQPHEEAPTTSDVHGEIAVTNDLPSEETLKQAGEILVFTPDGKSRPFRELFTGEGNKRVMVIFIRHFMCGNCQDYLRELGNSITPEAVAALPQPTRLVIMGCGSPDVIAMYQKEVGCAFPIYAEPSRKLYDALGMTRTLNLGPKPDYVKKSLVTSAVQSFIYGLKSGRGALKSGDIKQIGGEFLFEDYKVIWCHRMRHTRDHAGIPDVRVVLGLDPATASDGEDRGRSREPTAVASAIPPSRRRSLDVGAMVKRMSGEWSRSRSKAGSEAAPKEVASQAAEGTNGVKHTKITNGTTQEEFHQGTPPPSIQ